MRAKDVYNAYFQSRNPAEEVIDAAVSLKKVYIEAGGGYETAARRGYTLRSKRSVMVVVFIAVIVLTFAAVPQTRAAFGWFFQLFQPDDRVQAVSRIAVDLDEFILQNTLALDDGQAAAVSGELHGNQVFIVLHPKSASNGSLTDKGGEKYTVDHIRVSGTGEATCYLDDDGFAGVIPVSDGLLFVTMTGTERELFTKLLRHIIIES